MCDLKPGILLPLLLFVGLLPGTRLSAQTDCEAQSEIPSAECEALVSLWQQTGGLSWDIHFGWAETNSPCTWYGVSCSGGQVRELILRLNNLVGPIPPGLADLPGLRVLDLRFNGLTGTLPPELAALPELVFLLIDSNALTGPIPAQLGELPNLELLYLEDNGISGPLPPELAALPQLAELRLGDNRLTGFIPPQLENFGPSLSTLSLRGNLLQGPIPMELGSLSGLTVLDLAGNDLEGPIPEELGQLSNLVTADLGGNLLSGEVPVELLDLQNIAPGGFAIPDNCLTASDPAVRAFLDHGSPGWEASQCLRLRDDDFERGDLSRWNGTLP